MEYKIATSKIIRKANEYFNSDTASVDVKGNIIIDGKQISDSDRDIIIRSLI